jgi:serine/threonine protein kinase
MTFRAGHQISNYRIVKHIGTGSTGDVYVAVHLGLQRQVALKVLRTPLNQKEVANFKREAQQLAKLQHPNILAIHDYIVEQGTPILVTEFAPGGSLRDVFDDTPGPKLLAGAMAWIKQVSSALQYAHQQKVVHRDVKPDNVLIDAAGNFRLADFGLAVVDHATVSRTSLQTAAGTPLYAAPEQSRHRAVAASDQYALACTIWEWICGEPPFTGDPIALLYFHMHELPDDQQLVGASDAVKQVLLRALAKDPNLRFPTVEEFTKALEQAASGAILAQPAPAPAAQPAAQPKAKLTCPRCGHENVPGRKYCGYCGSALPSPVMPTIAFPAQATPAVTPTQSIEQGDAFDKVVKAINASITKRSGQDQYSFDYLWIEKQGGIHSSLSREFLQRLIDHYKQAGWHAWLYEHGRDISGVAEDPAFVLDAPGSRRR